MKNYPLFCGFQELVMGKGFFAGISAFGRALAIEEAQGRGWWLHSVNPGGIAVHGETLKEAHSALVRAFRSHALSVASEVSDFSSFKVEIEHFFHDSDEKSRQEWLDALAHVRANPAGIVDLPRYAGESPIVIHVVEIATPTPAENRIEDETPAIAA